MANAKHSSKAAPCDFSQVVAAEHSHPDIASNRSVALQSGGVGLALSGGGIRSATFSLGVLQALAARGKLNAFDYLSTVSGGGYIGSWLSAWIHREKDGIGEVQRALAQIGSSGGLDPQANEPSPVVWLRKYSNYLTPRLGLLSVDSLTLSSIYVRNVLLNLLIVIAFIASIVLLPPLLVPLVPKIVGASWVPFTAYALGLLILPLAICLNLVGVSVQSRHAAWLWLAKSRGVLVSTLVPGAMAAIFGSLSTFGGEFGYGDFRNAFAFAAVALGVAGLVWLVMQLRGSVSTGAQGARRAWRIAGDGADFVVAAVVSIGTVLCVLWASRQFFSTSPASTDFDYVKLLVFGPPAFLVTYGIGGFVFVGLAGRAYYERSREWWSRLNAWFFIVGASWFLLMFTSLYGPAMTRWVAAECPAWISSLAGSAWVGSLLATIFGSRIKSLSKVAGQSLMSVLNVAAYVVIIGLVLGIATGARQALTAIERTDLDAKVTACRHASSPQFKQSLTRFQKYVSDDVDEISDSCAATVAGVPVSVAGLGACIAVMLLFGWRIDVNKFSLHNMYKNRLTRCYLGASRQRKPQPFTGFDEDDDVRLAELSSQRPLHILNTCLNIAQGKNLAWQERKGASFVLTPMYCGFSFGKSQGDTTLRDNAAAPLSGAESARYASIAGFRPTDQYSGDDDSAVSGYTLGMAMAVSGAAASPNMGANTKPGLAFVMTLFNARLGRWTANPAGRKWKARGPVFGMICYLQELFGWSNERRNFVYLSDGGHFENLGVYELVRRRCRCIWVVDASADPKRNCEDLGRAIRQCRVDFGVEISLNLADLVASTGKLLPKSGFARGTIKYNDGGRPGEFIYIKPSLCADAGEPDDLLAYAKREESFPHQTTADQFFDESQFESYRRLGLHIGTRCLEEHLSTLA